jgi:hypothetical protein
MELLETIRAAWGFVGLDPESIVDTNAFGNILVRDVSDRYWRICPEELSCQLVAPSSNDFRRLRSSAEFERDWQMQHLVALARSKFGFLTEGRCYCLKIPAVLGGAYDVENLATITLLELVAASGAIAVQIGDLPDGARVRLVVE